MESTDFISWDDFERVDIRVGRILAVYPFPEARKPAYRLKIDFGALGVKKCSAQVTNYAPEDLQGRQVAAVVNFPPKQIGPAISEVLVLGGLEANGQVRLLRPDPDCELGSKVA